MKPYHFLFLLLLWTGCKKTSDVGMNVLPGLQDDPNAYIDTFTVTSKTLLQDSVRGDDFFYMQIGDLNDPVMGNVQSAFYSQFVPFGNNISFGDHDSLLFDSLILNLYVNGYYGDGAKALKIKAEEMTSNIHTDSVYYTFQSQTTNGIDLVKDSLLYSKAKIDSFFANTCYIKLDSSLGKKILFADAASLTDKASFTNFFKGLKIFTEQVSAETGVIYTVDVLSSNTQLKLYYKLKTNGVWTDKTYSFYVGTGAAHYHQISRNNTAGTLYADALTASSNLYEFVSGGQANYLYYEFPNIKNYGPLGINHAILEIYTDKSLMQSPFVSNPSLLVFASDTSSGKIKPGASLSVEASYDSTNGKYSFLLTAPIQAMIMNNATFKGFVITPKSISSSPARSVIYSSKAFSGKPKLKIYGTKIN